MLHACVRDILDPSFVKFYEEHVVDISPPPEIWDPSVRYQKSPFSSADLPVVRSYSRDIEIKEGLSVRVYFPKKRRTERLRPVVLWFHGGMFFYWVYLFERSN